MESGLGVKDSRLFEWRACTCLKKDAKQCGNAVKINYNRKAVPRSGVTAASR